MARPDLLAPDSLLPKRDVLLDASEMTQRLPVLLGVPPGTPVGCLERLRTKYHVGESLRVLHRLCIGGATHLVSTRMATAERIPRLAAAVGDGAGQVGGLRAVVHDRELDAVSWVFPFDRKLPGLPELMDERASVLADVGVAASTTEVAGYAPEKSVTLRCTDRAGRVTAYAKLYADCRAVVGLGRPVLAGRRTGRLGRRGDATRRGLRAGSPPRRLRGDAGTAPRPAVDSRLGGRDAQPRSGARSPPWPSSRRRAAPRALHTGCPARRRGVARTSAS